MSERTPAVRGGALDLADLVDRVIDVGAVVCADASIGVADVPLVRLALRLVIASAETFDARAGPCPTTPAATAEPGGRGPASASRAVARDVEPRSAPASPSPPPILADGSGAGPAPDRTADGTRGSRDDAATARGLAQLVLTVVELLREVLERQAVRRAEADTLTDDQVERLGDTLLALDQRMDELVEIFGLDRDDLHLTLDLLE